MWATELPSASTVCTVTKNYPAAFTRTERQASATSSPNTGAKMALSPGLNCSRPKNANAQKRKNWPGGLRVNMQRWKPAGAQHPRIVPTFPYNTDTVTAYYAHYENIRQHLTVEDFSRVDAMIALRLRATGHISRSWLKPCASAPPPSERKRKAAIGNAMRNVQRLTPSA